MQKLYLWIRWTLGIGESHALLQAAALTACLGKESCEAVLRAAAEGILSSGEKILKKTPDMLPALKQAGVVDSGGRGLMLIYQGYAAVLRGEDISSTDNLMEDDVVAVSYDCHDLTKDLTYCYCVSFTLSHFREDCDEHDLDSFRRRLNRIGDNVSVSGDLNEAEVHVHTDNPGFVLDYGIELAEISHVKIDNLAAMKRELDIVAQPAHEKEEAAPVTVHNEPQNTDNITEIKKNCSFTF